MTLYYILITVITSCSMWVNSIPTRADVIAACGAKVESALSEYTLTATYIDDPSYVECSLRGDEIYYIDIACPLKENVIDLYRLTLSKSEETIICPLELDHFPTSEDVATLCPDAGSNYQIVTAGPAADDPIPAPICPLADPTQPASLATSEDLYLLAARLIWYGLATPECDGWSGIDPESGAATECGMASARAEVIEWQNQYDDLIMAEAIRWQIPADVLKRVMLHESQMWSWGIGSDGEVGLIQLTDNGLDTLLRYDPATSDYVTMSADEQLARRQQIRAALICEQCSPWEAAQAERDNIEIYARALRAFHCRAGGQDWQITLNSFNGSETYAEMLGY